MKKYYAALGAFLLLTACSNKVDLEAMSAEEIYNYAMDEMEKTRYAKAETAFEALETDHPYSQWAVRAKLMSAYAYYKDEKYDEAVMAVDRFIKYHPGNKDVPYALYLKGMCYYDQISAADKDQGNTQKAAETFALLMVMYPESEYAKDAAGKMNLTEDYKAGQEMIVGRYYLHEGNYLSALNRFNVVLENYQKTIQIEEALYREVEIYAIFGLNNYANGYFKILKKNYPEGKWTAKAEKIMKKIGVEVQPSKKVAKPKEEQPQKVEEESKGWFSGWFGGDDENKTEKAKAETTEPVEVVKEENKGWFSGWFGGSKDKAEIAPAVVEQKAAPVVQAKDAATIADEEKQAETLEKMVSKTNNSEKDIGNDNASWFDEWRNGNKAEEAKPVTERESWFDGWFGGSEDKAEEVKADTAKKVESVKKESQKAADAGKAKAAQSAKAVKAESGESIEQVRQELQKIVDTDDADAEEAVEPKERRSGWFSGWFHGGSEISDDMAKSKKAANETINESLDKAREESKNAVDTAEELQESAEDTAKPEEKKSGWFSGLFSGGTLAGDDNAE